LSSNQQSEIHRFAQRLVILIPQSQEKNLRLSLCYR
jgi:hypothetical protein